MATTIQVGQVWEVPFTVTRNGVVDVDSVVDIGTSSPSSLTVALAGPRTLRVTAIGASNSVGAVVKTDPGTGAQVNTSLEFRIIVPAIVPAVTVFGTPVQIS
jgi:hypothetical protein